MKGFLNLLFGFTVFLIPVVVLGQGDTNNVLSNVSSTIGQVGTIIQTLVTIVFVLSILYFFWNLTTFLLSADEAEKRKSAKGQMIYGVIVIAVMASVWGLVALLQQAVGVNEGNNSVKNINVPGIIDRKVGN